MKPFPLILAVAALAGCEQAPATAPAASSTPTPTAETSPREAQASVAPLTVAGPAATISADPSPDAQTGAWVVRVDTLAKQGEATVKLYGMAGGDPAMNGLQTYLAFYLSPADGWRVFGVGDVLEYRVLSEAPGRVDLELEESVLNPETTVISSRRRRIILAWTPSADGAPTAVTATPAR